MLGLLECLKSLFLSLSDYLIYVFLEVREFIHDLLEYLFLQFQYVAVTSRQIGVITRPVHDDIGLTEYRTLQIILILVYAFYASLQQKEDFAGS
jgi:hypothetical protein